MTYLVMENHLSYSLVLDEEGRFIKVANMGYELGELLENVYPMEIKEKTKVIPPKYLVTISSLAATFLLFLTVLFNLGPKPYASIYIKINPEIKMEVSKEGYVLDIIPINEDAKTLLKDYKWKKKNMNQVSKELVDSAMDLGFLSDGGKVTINIDSPDEVWHQNTGVEFRKDLDEFLTEKISVTIEINPIKNQDKAENKEDIKKKPAVDPKDKKHSSDYDDSDYGDSKYDYPYYKKENYKKKYHEKQDLDDDSNYDDTDYDNSDYEESNKEESDYNLSDYEEDSKSDYDDSDYDNSKYGNDYYDHEKENDSND